MTRTETRIYTYRCDHRDGGGVRCAAETLIRAPSSAFAAMWLTRRGWAERPRQHVNVKAHYCPEHK